MHNEELIREIAVKACSEALQHKSQELAEDVARRMADELAGQPDHSAELLRCTEELSLRNQELAARTEELRIRDGELREHAEQVQALYEELRNRGEELRLRDGELSERTEELRKQVAELQVRDAELKEANEKIEIRDDELRWRTDEMEKNGETALRFAKDLRSGVIEIGTAKTQSEVLDNLLKACAAVTPTCGVLILRGNQASGWNCHQLTTPDNFKRATMDCAHGVAASVISSCTAIVTEVCELDPVFTARIGLESSAQAILVPVLHKEHVAALVLAVSQHENDIAGLELLAQVAQLSLDLYAFRKSVPAPAPEPRGVIPARPAQALAATQSTAPSAPKPEPEHAHPAAPAAARTAFVPSTTAAVAATHPPSDDVHEKARRFAKLLVDEIKLYNQAKVTEGRARGDLYSRLRDDIEKSRSAYQKRYGENVKDVDFFTQELLRILADNNPGVMGAGFPG